MTTSRTGVAIVTGAGTGIGRSAALQLAEAGYAVALVGRRVAKLRESAETIGDAAETLVIPADIADPQAPKKILDVTLARWGQVDVLVNNAGTVSDVALGQTTDDLLDESFAVNAFGPARLIAQLWPVFERQAGGCVVNVSSISTVDPFPGLSVYAAAKSALESLARSVTSEGREIGVRAYNVAPGIVETDMLRSLWSEDEIPREQTLPPDEVARVVVECVLGKRPEGSGSTIVVRG
jgi:NAD(P)-dependent dehydrogenase (short-subunit alcohol dehydrogenase family)